jgi:hypothetical protein
MYTFNVNSSSIVEDFLKDLESSVKEANKIMDDKKPLKMTSAEKLLHERNQCHICRRCIDIEENPKNYKVADHCNITGKYRGPAHKNCNLQYRFNMKFPVYFHNLKGYDSHHIIKSIGKIVSGTQAELGCIPTNNEKYLSFNWGKMHFIDTFQFMSYGLDKLAGYLKYDDLKHTREYFEKQKIEEEKIKLVTKKGIFPYDWFDCKEKMNNHCLPSMDSFYSKLSESKIS